MRYSAVLILAAVVLAGGACAGPRPEEAQLVGETTREIAHAVTASVAPEPAKEEAPTEPDVITIHAVGDCAIGDLHYGAGAPGSFAAQLAAVDDPMGYPFSMVREIFEKDDLTIANLEGSFTDRKAWQNPVFSIRGNPEHAKVLVRGGVDMVDVYNNHSFDYGAEGHEDTKAALAAAGVAYFGKDAIDRRTIKGIRMVNLGYLGGPEGTKKQMLADIARERTEANTMVIVSFHWGVEAFYATHPDQTRLGRAAIDAGADLVLGHHPHVLQGIETYKGRHIVYSLGNFVFGANSQPKDPDSIIFRERFHLTGGPGARKVDRVENTIIPVRISGEKNHNDFRPVLIDGEEGARVLAKVDKLSRAL